MSQGCWTEMVWTWRSAWGCTCQVGEAEEDQEDTRRGCRGTGLDVATPDGNRRKYSIKTQPPWGWAFFHFCQKKKKKGRTKDYRKYDLLYTNSCFLCNWQLNLLGRFCVMCFLCRAPRCSSAAHFSSCGRACRRKWWELSHIKGCTTVPKHPLTPVKQFYHLA